ncbi:MAG: DNA-3-methyladenine glycosylase I [Acidobacteria bacterium]|nr:DNA-3-methyladenine glycosylase I [Acidobacteriota bacterium]
MDTEWANSGADGRIRCWWPGDAADYRSYHDEEWGRPCVEDLRLFEKICLEGFQSGLSWLTILRKRENFRAAFADFNFAEVAAFDDDEVERLLGDAGIVRHRKKIESTINNARRAIEMVDECGSLAAYFWSFEPDPAETLEVEGSSPMPSKTPTSGRLAKDLRARGWSFVGPTTAYAFMQAMGLVNDHVDGCEWGPICAELRKNMTIPSV